MLTENIDTVSDSISVDVGRCRSYSPSNCVENDAEKVAFETSEVIGDFCDGRLTDCLQLSERILSDVSV